MQRLKVLWFREPLIVVTVVMVSAALPLPFVLPPLIGDRTEPHKPTGARALRGKAGHSPDSSLYNSVKKNMDLSLIEQPTGNNSRL